MRLRTRATLTAAAAAALATTTLTGAAPAVTAGPAGSPAVEACEDEPGSAARQKPGATAQEPPLYAPKDANKYGVIPDLPDLAPGSVTIDTVFHVLTDTVPSKAERTRTERMITAQMQVLNDAFAGTTADDAADTAFRFDLVETTWTVDKTWAQVTPGKTVSDAWQAFRAGGLG